VTLRLETESGAIVVDSFDDAAETDVIGAPSHLDERTLAFLQRITVAANERVRDANSRAQRAAADATHEAVEKIAAHFEAKNRGRGCHVPSGVVVDEIRGLAWAGRRAA
jgi:hypothetical protein